MANRYFKLAAGNNNWSAIGTWCTLADGSDPGASVPTSADNVYPSASIAAGATLTVDATAYCLDMDWTGATNSPTFARGNSNFSANGNITFIAAMVFTGAANAFYLSGTGTLTTNGLTIQSAIGVNGAGITVTLLDDFTSTTILYLFEGTLVTGNKTVACATFSILGAGAKVLTSGTSVINCSGWDYTGTNLTLTANTATIKVTGTGVFTGGGLTYYEVQLNGTAHTISGSNTFTNLILKADTTQTITFTDGTTQTITTPNITGSIGKVKTLQGSSTGGWAISKASGRVVCDYLSVSYSTASGGAAFYAGGNSTDGGNNTGWMFAKAVVSGMTKARVLSLVLWKR